MLSRLSIPKFNYALATFLLCSGPAQALDTDVYLNQVSSVQPNIMFAMDTSGSMFSTMRTTYDYVPGQTYSGDFDRNKFYVSTDGRIPSAPAGVSNGDMTALQNCLFSLQQTSVYGFTAIRTAIAFDASSNVDIAYDQWVPASKVRLEGVPSNTYTIECSDDSGLHGDLGKPYAASSGGTLYSSDRNKEIDWDKFPFVTVFTGNYLNYKNYAPSNAWVSRANVLKRVIRDAVLRTPNAALGLVRFQFSSGGIILRRARDNTVRANQQEALNILASLYGNDWTPLATQLLEILHYYNGYKTFYGPYYNTDPQSHTGGIYNSPIQYSCQKSYVLLVTDGAPSQDSASVNYFTSYNGYQTYPDYSKILGKTRCSGSCLDEIAKYMSKHDAAPWLEDKYDLDGDGDPDPQTVKVYPIGMELNSSLLESTAAAAGTTSYYAKDAAEFENAFVDILAEITQSGGVSLVTAASSNDRFSKTSNRDYLYYGQFVPESKYQWRGNLKKYRMAYKSDGTAYVTDSNTSNPAIITDSGGIASTAKSYWSATVDGNNTLEGGFNDRLKAMGSSSRTIRGIHSDADSYDNIMSNTNKLTNTSNSYYRSELNISGRSTSEQNAIINYALGKDAHDIDDDNNTAEQRGSIGAIVRSSPIPVQFGGTSSDPEIVVFITTTDGMLHAIDDDTGQELWAVMLPEAYSHLALQYENSFSTNPWWGVDGSMTVRTVDNNANGKIEEADGDKVLLYISGGLSMRRWFIFDVTRATEASGQIKLVKRGKYDATSSDWEELGLATSPMVPLSYRLKNDDAGVIRRGMLYANGWDATAEFSYGESAMGRGISLYDSDTGNPLWKMTKNSGGSDMLYAFPTQPTTVDVNGDGYTDLIYAIDVNAQIWRFNVHNGANSTSQLITGGKLAKLGSDTVGERRRAYKRIDAAVFSSATSTQVALAVGTGDRMNPLSESDDDRIHVIYDRTATSGVNPTKVLTPTDLYNATENLIGEGSEIEIQREADKLSAASGWYIDLPDKQKSISAPLISQGTANFPVYEVGDVSTDPCENRSAGTGLLYRVSILDATPISDYDNSGSSDLTKTDRYSPLRGSGIPSDVGYHTASTGKKTLIVNFDTFSTSVSTGDPSVPEASTDFKGDSAGYWFENRD